MNRCVRVRIVIVEDDSILREELRHFLEDHDFVVFEASLGISLDELLAEEPIDLILLDINLPGESGFEIAPRIKRNFPHIGIAILSARSGLSDRIKSYESGADLYLAKPTHPSEILAALRSLARRKEAVNESGDSWTLDVRLSHLVAPDKNKLVRLTVTEFNIMLALVRAQKNQLEVDSLSELISRNSERGALSKRAIENSISRLRKKIATVIEQENCESIIDSIWGYGYKLCIPVVISQ